MAWIGKYLEEARPVLIVEPDEGFVFLTVQGQPIGKSNLSLIVRNRVRASGCSKRGSCHLFRHTMATLLHENGADLKFVQAMLGHSKITSTEIYTHVAIRKLKEIHTALHPGARLRPRSAETEGVLEKSEAGGLALAGRALSPGTRLEVLIGTQWIPGHLHADGPGTVLIPEGADSKLELKAGMSARLPGAESSAERSEENDDPIP